MESINTSVAQHSTFFNAHNSAANNFYFNSQDNSLNVHHENNTYK
jgi:hypothetical protein